MWVVGSLLGERIEVLRVLASFAQPEGVELDDFLSVAAAVFRRQVSENSWRVVFDGKVRDGMLGGHGDSPKGWIGGGYWGVLWRRWGEKASKKLDFFGRLTEEGGDCEEGCVSVVLALVKHASLASDWQDVERAEQLYR